MEFMGQNVMYSKQLIKNLSSGADIYSDMEAPRYTIFEKNGDGPQMFWTFFEFSHTNWGASLEVSVEEIIEKFRDKMYRTVRKCEVRSEGKFHIYYGLSSAPNGRNMIYNLHVWIPDVIIDHARRMEIIGELRSVITGVVVQPGISDFDSPGTIPLPWSNYCDETYGTRYAPIVPYYKCVIVTPMYTDGRATSLKKSQEKSSKLTSFEGGLRAAMTPYASALEFAHPGAIRRFQPNDIYPDMLYVVSDTNTVWHEINYVISSAFFRREDEGQAVDGSVVGDIGVDGDGTTEISRADLIGLLNKDHFNTSTHLGIFRLTEIFSIFARDHGHRALDEYVEYLSECGFEIGDNASNDIWTTYKSVYMSSVPKPHSTIRLLHYYARNKDTGNPEAYITIRLKAFAKGVFSINPGNVGSKLAENLAEYLIYEIGYVSPTCPADKGGAVYQQLGNKIITGNLHTYLTDSFNSNIDHNLGFGLIHELLNLVKKHYGKTLPKYDVYGGKKEDAVDMIRGVINNITKRKGIIDAIVTLYDSQSSRRIGNYRMVGDDKFISRARNVVIELIRSSCNGELKEFLNCRQQTIDDYPLGSINASFERPTDDAIRGIKKIFKDYIDNDMSRTWFQDQLSRSLFGFNSKQVFFHLGTGSMGKSSFLSMLKNLFGDYGYALQQNSLGKMATGDGPTPGLYAAMTKYFVTMEETKTEIDAGLFNMISGGEADMAFRTLYGVPINGKFTAKIHIASNDEPKFSSVDQAVVNRIILVRPSTKYVTQSVYDAAPCKDGLAVIVQDRTIDYNALLWVIYHSYGSYKETYGRDLIDIPEEYARARDRYAQKDEYLRFIRTHLLDDKHSSVNIRVAHEDFIRFTKSKVNLTTFRDNISKRHITATDLELVGVRLVNPEDTYSERPNLDMAPVPAITARKVNKISMGRFFQTMQPANGLANIIAPVQRSTLGLFTKRTGASSNDGAEFGRQSSSPNSSNARGRVIGTPVQRSRQPTPLVLPAAPPVNTEYTFLEKDFSYTDIYKMKLWLQHEKIPLTDRRIVQDSAFNNDEIVELLGDYSEDQKKLIAEYPLTREQLDKYNATNCGSIAVSTLNARAENVAFSDTGSVASGVRASAAKPVYTALTSLPSAPPRLPSNGSFIPTSGSLGSAGGYSNASYNSKTSANTTVDKTRAVVYA